ncbi:hypothetical protein NVP1187O_220 [Vibrio phage 1.187.O._10N.286.49.F1]|nr:hypothetical protein NVP1187O_220 [Vibrio phage 1.187.O._10N.286.49.F1]
MNGFEMWKQDKHNMKYQTPDLMVMLIVKQEMQTVTTSKKGDKSYSYIGWTVNRVYVIMAETPKDYCGELEILEKSEFGEYSEESYQEAVTYFKTLVSNLL